MPMGVFLFSIRDASLPAGGLGLYVALSRVRGGDSEFFGSESLSSCSMRLALISLPKRQ